MALVKLAEAVLSLSLLALAALLRPWATTREQGISQFYQEYEGRQERRTKLATYILVKDHDST